MYGKPRNFADCSLYGKSNAEGYNAGKQLAEFIITGQRINYGDASFKLIRDNLKSRVNAAVLYRLLQRGNIIFVIAKQELPAAFKIMYAKDIKGTKQKAIFLDVTGLIYEEGGMFHCKDIDKFSTYLLGILANHLYYIDNDRLMRNSNLQKRSVSAFCKMFCEILNYFRITGYLENKERIFYITGIYFAYTVMGLDINTARKVSMVANKISDQDAKASDYYYVMEDDFNDIETFCKSIISTFKLTGLTINTVLEKWVSLYGKGTHFALELYPAFLQTIVYAYSGTYLNNWKRIESVTGNDMVEITNIILKAGADSIERGFTYESFNNRDYYKDKYLMELNVKDNNSPSTSTNKLKTSSNTSSSASSSSKTGTASTTSTGGKTSTANIKAGITTPSSSNTLGTLIPSSTNGTSSSNTHDSNNPTPMPGAKGAAEKFISSGNKTTTNTKPSTSGKIGALASKTNTSTKDKPTVISSTTKKATKTESYTDLFDNGNGLDYIDEIKHIKEIIKKTIAAGDLKKQWQEKITNMVSGEWARKKIDSDQEDILKKNYDIMNDKEVSYKDYKKAFNYICKSVGIPYQGTIIELVEFDNDGDDRRINVRYSKGVEKVEIPEGFHLVHISPVNNIDKSSGVTPTFRSKVDGRYFYCSKRCYFTIDKDIDLWKGGMAGQKTYKYVTKEDYKYAYIDPACNNPSSRAVYIESDNSIPVVKVEDKFRDIKNAVVNSFYNITKRNSLQENTPPDSKDDGKPLQNPQASQQQAQNGNNGNVNNAQAGNNKQPNVTTPAPVKQAKPNVTTPAPVKQPKPNVTTPAPVKQPKPNVTTPAPVKQPKPNVTTPAPVKQPKPNVTTPGANSNNNNQNNNTDNNNGGGRSNIANKTTMVKRSIGEINKLGKAASAMKESMGEVNNDRELGKGGVNKPQQNKYIDNTQVGDNGKPLPKQDRSKPMTAKDSARANIDALSNMKKTNPNVANSSVAKDVVNTATAALKKIK